VLGVVYVCGCVRMCVWMGVRMYVCMGCVCVYGVCVRTCVWGVLYVCVWVVLCVCVWGVSMCA